MEPLQGWAAVLLEWPETQLLSLRATHHGGEEQPRGAVSAGHLLVCWLLQEEMTPHGMEGCLSLLFLKVPLQTNEHLPHGHAQHI